MGVETWSTQLRKGVVELAVLATLAEREAYGYEIIRRLGEERGFATTESAVYPVLARLTKSRMLSVRTARSPVGPPRRYYRLTVKGEARLARMMGGWRQLRATVDGLLENGVSTGSGADGGSA